MIESATERSRDLHGLEIIEVENEQYFRIRNAEWMRPFLMTIVSAGDHWMFIGSNGGLTAGRRNAESALFPYYTDDMVLEMAGSTGNRTLVRVQNEDKEVLWEPFAKNGVEMFRIHRSVYKNAIGNKVVFEEENLDLKLRYRYMWTFSEQFGFVKRSSLLSRSDTNRSVAVLDGVSNIMPSGVPSQLQVQRSTLVDAYKRNELDPETGVAIFALSARIVDKAEPSESLSATTAWSIGQDVEKVLLCGTQISAFRRGKPIVGEVDILGEKGCYLNLMHLELAPEESKGWYQVYDVNQSHTDLHNIRALVAEGDNIKSVLEEDIKRSTEALRNLVSQSDGMQRSADVHSASRHYSNVLFNIMRGGIFDENYTLPVNDLLTHIRRSNRAVFSNHEESMFKQWPDKLELHEMVKLVSETGDADLFRICMEYLPLYFSRRHGDPSRPWNYFSIDTRGEHGEKMRNYEGNWRDIFQNWEALAYSFPEFTENFIVRFLNASTIDGYNPYRISREGIDWEVEEEDDPWSYIGYWGDHQIIYLLKLLELSAQFHPGKLEGWLDEKLFVYANVPYRIKSYHDLVLDPKNTIVFDHELDKLTRERTERIGSDGKLVWNEDELPVRASLAEKLLVTLGAKLSNFIPRAGIWLNTQRPEWNDANNALVGNGVSMVTLCYLRRYIHFLFGFFKNSGVETLRLNRPVAQKVLGLEEVFSTHIGLLVGNMTDEARRAMVDDLGAIGEQYRALAYAGFSGRVDKLHMEEVLSLLELALRFCDDAIRHNKREDGLYHSYNLIDLTGDRASIRHLYEMLEGQVAVLSTGLLSAEESLTLLDSLKVSQMFRPDQYSYMLYPNRSLDGFLEKNNISEAQAQRCPLFEQLVEADNLSLVERDVHDTYHFNASIHNEEDVKEILQHLSDSGWEEPVQLYGAEALHIFEELFDHSAFTGRSGTFFGYEGLGSIYWHMVSKLLLSVQETIHWSLKRGVSDETFGRLVEHYYEIRAGIGVNKSPELYGAFPTDAYSHTPINAGAQQPGMTGQVKEDVINRWAELGVYVETGKVSFQPKILRGMEFLKEPESFNYVGLDGQVQRLHLEADSLGFTFCQVPVVYRNGSQDEVRVELSDGSTERLPGAELSFERSRSLFRRDGSISRISVTCSQHL